MQPLNGLYDELITESLAQAIAAVPSTEPYNLAPLSPDEASQRIAAALASQ
jgi:hypothetical protein